MNLNTQQVADKLGVSRPVILKMAKKGILRDLKPQNGGKKHFPEFDLKEIQEFKKTHTRVGRVWYSNENAPKAMVSDLKPLNGKRVDVSAAPAPTSSEPTAGLFTRLTRIEEKLDALVKIWS